MQVPDVEVLTRFEEGADRETRAQFAKDLIAALERLKVEPGDQFDIITPGMLDDLVSDAEEEIDAARAMVADGEALMELIEDWSRGVVRDDELLTKARNL